MIEECSFLDSLIVNGEVRSLRTSHGAIKADAYVLAAGCWTRGTGT